MLNDVMAILEIPEKRKLTLLSDYKEILRTRLAEELVEEVPDEYREQFMLVVDQSLAPEIEVEEWLEENKTTTGDLSLAANKIMLQVTGECAAAMTTNVSEEKRNSVMKYFTEYSAGK